MPRHHCVSQATDAKANTVSPQHIFMRRNTTTEQSIPQRLTQMAEGLTRPNSDLSARNALAVSEAIKDKRYGCTRSDFTGGSFSID